MSDGPKTRGDLTVVDLDGEAVVYDERSGDLHHLNETANEVFARLDGTITIRQLAHTFAEAVDVPVEEIERQVVDVVAAFQEAGLLDPASSQDRSSGA